MPSTASLGKGILLVLVGLTQAGCQGTGSSSQGEPYTPPAELEPDSIGYFLAEYDKSLRRWTDLRLAPASQRDARMLRALDLNLRQRAIKRKQELVGVLETGPRSNREVAAVALGFTGDPSVLSPLLAALADPNESVVEKVLLGLGVLADPETPLAKILFLLQAATQPWTRSNAAYALHCIVAAGGNDDSLPEACRMALTDEEPGVRAQAASVLGMIHDADSIQNLGDLLQDDVNLALQAAATALARIGREHVEKKGVVARLLVDALDRVERSQRPWLIRELMRLADRNLGEESDPWREWAYRLP